MTTAYKAIDDAIANLDRLRQTLKKKVTKQVNASEERSIIKATALAWFNNHRSKVIATVNSELTQDIDRLYKEILSASDRSTSRLIYGRLFKSIRKELSQIRGYAVMPTTRQSIHQTTDEPPKFDPLISDLQMQKILSNRWIECSNCLTAAAPLAATVMMGGLLEALLLARVNKETNKAPIFKAKVAPKDKTGKTIPLKEWTLKHYIDVAHELKWISQSAKDIGVVLRDYRNYVHPYKEFSHGITLVEDDAKLLWEVSKNIAKQIIRDKTRKK